MYMYFFCWLPRLLLLPLLLPPPGIRRKEENARLFAWGYFIVIIVNTIGNCISTFVVGTCIYVVSGGLRQKQWVMMVSRPSHPISLCTILFLAKTQRFNAAEEIVTSHSPPPTSAPTSAMGITGWDGNSFTTQGILSHCHTPAAMTSE